MRPENEPRPLLLGTIIAIVVLILFGLSLSAVLLLSVRGSQSVSLVSTPTFSPVTQTSAARLTPPSLVPTGLPPVSLGVTGTPVGGLTSPAVTPTLSVTPTVVAGERTTAPTVAARLYWPEYLPAGMSLALQDSWPFRVIAVGLEHEPFLVFRGAENWLLIRKAPDLPQALPQSATSAMLSIAGTSVAVARYPDGGFKLLLPREDQTIQMSGQGVSDGDIIAIVEGLRPLDDDTLRTRLSQVASDQPLHVTMLWPTVLPPGLSLVPSETIAQFVPQGTAAPDDRYQLSFRGSDSLVQIGGGNVVIPRLEGGEEVVTSGSLRGVLTTNEEQQLLVVDLGSSAASGELQFPDTATSGSERLPLVQKGLVYLWAENVERAQFDQIVAGLIPLRLQEFVARANGQRTYDLTYLWPGTLPAGYRLDLRSVRVSWDDFILQGGLPYYEVAAVGPGAGTVILRGGREAAGAAVIVPEGPGVERATASVRGRVASTARTPDGVTVVWSENGATYQLTSPAMTVEELVIIADGLQTVTVEEFFERMR